MELQKLFDTLRNNYDKTEHNISVDCVLFTIKNDRLNVLLAQLFTGKDWVLPGGFIFKNEDTDSAAVRILKQRTGVDNIYLQQFKIFSGPERFPIQALIKELGYEDKFEVSDFPARVVSIGYFALVNYELLSVTGGEFGEDTTWADVKNLPTVKFDHSEIISEATEALRKELYFKPIAYNLLPEKFTMPDLQNLYEIILDKTLERSSFQRKMLKWDIYERLDEKKTGVAHKQPYLYRFNREKYQLAVRKGIRFGI
jgi:8-oxo-dGTP diphosphatase